MNADSIHMSASSLLLAATGSEMTNPTETMVETLAPLLNPNPSIVALILLISIMVWVKTTFDEGAFGFWTGLGLVSLVAGWGTRPEQPTLGTVLLVVPLVAAALGVTVTVVMIRRDDKKQLGRLHALSPDLSGADARDVLYRTHLWGGVVKWEQREGLSAALCPAGPHRPPGPVLRPVTLARWYIEGHSPERLLLALQGGLDDTMLNRHMDGDLPVDWDTIEVMAALRADR